VLVSRAAGGHLNALDLARGIAALAVALFHFTTNGWLPQHHWLAEAGWYGHLGVRTFFVISGFVVPLAMWRGGYKRGAFVPFMARRMVRLYPPYLASICLMGCSVWITGQTLSPGALGAHLLYLNDLAGLPWLIDVYWTLAVEVQFYLIVALAWPAVAAGRTKLFLPLLLLGAAPFLGLPGRHLLHYGDYFLLGIAAFRWYAVLGSRPLNLAVGVASLIAIGCSDGWPAALASAVPIALLGVPMRVPAWGRFLGDISYSFYLFHLAAGAVVLSALGGTEWKMGIRVLLVGVALAASIALGWLAYRWIEMPAIGWAKRFSYRRTGSAEQTRID
jgi:peptidoglycan/LPS O-acetylase OafA/YrhL